MVEMNDTNPLLRYYRQFIGEPDQVTNVYAGFAIFFAGLGLTLTGIGIFFYSATLPPNELSTYSIRQVAAISASIGLPALLFGAVFLLPVDRQRLIIAGVGTGICILATGFFAWAYPYNWNVPTGADYSAYGVGIYTVGIVMVIASTGGALVAHRVERATDSKQPEGESVDEAAMEKQVEEDIERALDEANLSWGGVARTETKRLQLDTSSVDEIEQETVVNTATETRKTRSSVDTAVDQLKSFQGGDMNTDSRKTVTNQAAALNRLREQKRQNESGSQSVVDRIRNLF